MITREKARLLRRMIEIASASLSDTDALEVVELFREWRIGETVERGERRRYDGELYRCEQSHTTQADWTPDKTPAMWTKVAKPGEIPIWRQPTGAQDAYQPGDKVHYPTKDDPIYIDTAPDNVYPPGVSGWDLWTD